MVDFLADFYVNTTELGFKMTEEVRGPKRLAMSFDLMIATAHVLSGLDITRAFISFRSHAEGFLCTFPEGDGLRPAWDRHYRRHASALVSRVKAVVAALDEGRQGVPFVQDWIAALTPLRERAERLALDGVLTMHSGSASGGAHAEDGAADRSPFHRSLHANPRWAKGESSPGFLGYRLMLNFTYLLLTRLGIAPTERFLLCHLAANAVEECYGISAFELIGGSSATTGEVNAQ
jgi:hypothetical protein